MYKSKEKIIGFLDNFDLDKIPVAVVLEAKRAVLDTLGCMIAGVDTPLGKGLHKLAYRFIDKKGVTVFGLKKKNDAFYGSHVQQLYGQCP